MVKKIYLFTACAFFVYIQSFGQQFLMDIVDTSSGTGSDMFAIYRNNNSLQFSGYIQPQYQVAESNGTESFAGGDFAKNSNNRFMLRRGRIRFDYTHLNKEKLPVTNFVFQFDGTERGVFIRDFWGRFYENRWQLFSVTTGMFARPFGYEVNLSSANRESPERGRMSQILMPTERDLGVMLTFRPRKKDAMLRWLKLDAGVFNGQGLAGPYEYDSYKDIISRLSVRPVTIKPIGLTVSGGISTLQGGVVNQSPMFYRLTEVGGSYRFYSDSTGANVGQLSPRKYYGTDIQLKIPNRKGATELRAEYITGTQSGTFATSRTPGSYPADALNTKLPLYSRPFNGAYFYFLQHLGTEKLQLALKYDWYDPNTRVSGKMINTTGGMSLADIRFDTFGFGSLYYANPHVKFVIWYDIIRNENTAIQDFEKDIKDNVLTIRIQYSF